MTLPAAILPNYVSLDRQSQWHISGLLSTALESMTLPSRLKAQRETLDHLASALNVNGNQNIAKLRMSIDQTTALNGHNDRPARLAVSAQSRDTRMPSQDRLAVGSTPDEEELTNYDMDFFPTEVEQTRGRHNTKKPHVFGQAEAYRGKENPDQEDTNEEDQGHERARRRAAGLPIIHK